MNKITEFNDWDQWLNVHRLEQQVKVYFDDVIYRAISEEIKLMLEELKKVDPNNRHWNIRETLVSFQGTFIEQQRAANTQKWLEEFSKYINTDRLAYLIKVKDHLTYIPGTYFTEKELA